MNRADTQTLHQTQGTGRLEAFVRDLTVRGDDPRLAFGKIPEHAMEALISNSLGLYAWCTENIREYLPILDVKGKRCLTVAASGDHIINLLLAGAREVVAFDCVPAANDVAFLKMQALVNLKWSDPDHFRGSLWDEVLSPVVFAQLMDRTDDPFNALHSLIGQAMNGLPVGEAKSIFKRYQVSGRNAYITSSEQFETARAACAEALSEGNVSFVPADIRELPLLGLGSFDVIVLSNILQSAHTRLNSPDFATATKKAQNICRVDPKASAKQLIDTMIWPVARMLVPGGAMMASYTYSCAELDDTSTARGRARDVFGQTALRRAAFEPPHGFSVEEHAWESVNGERGGIDVAVIIRPTNIKPECGC